MEGSIHRPVQNQKSWGRPLRFALLLLALIGSLTHLLALDPNVPAGETVRDSWDFRAGLPDDSVTALLMDPDHFLWVGTEGGLARFDGQHFLSIPLSSAPDDAVRITSILLDPDGSLWTATASHGLLHCDRRNLTLVPITTPKSPSSTPVTGWIVGSDFDSRGVLWAALSDGTMLRAKPDPTQPPSHSLQKLTRQSFDCWALKRDTKDNLWCATTEGYIYIPNGTVTQSVQHPVTAGDPRANSLMAMTPGTTHPGVWIATRAQTVCRLEEGSVRETWNNLLRNGENIHSLLEDSHGILWAGTSLGRLLAISNGQILATYQTTKGFEDTITVILEGPGETLWLGVKNGGLHQLRAPPARLFGIMDGLTTPNVRAITQRQTGGLWVATEKGDLQTFEKGSFHPVPGTKALAESRILAMEEDRHGRLWIGAQGQGLFRYTPDSELSLIPGASPEHLLDIRAICQRQDGSLWIATRTNGLHHIEDPLSPRPSPRPFTTPNNLEIRFLQEDHQGRLWIATHGQGIWILENQTLRRVNTPFPATAIRWILEDSSGAIWATSNSNGLARIFPTASRTIDSQSGLPNNTVEALLELEPGRLCAITSSGLFAFHPHDLETPGHTNVINLLEHEALPYPNPTGGSKQFALIDHNNTCWIGTTHGLLQVKPSQLHHTHPLPRPATIQHVSSSGASVSLSNLKPGDPLLLPPGNGNLQITFSAPAYPPEPHPLYQHWLEGLEPSWSEPSRSSELSFNQLPPGTYSLHLRTRSSNPSTPPATITTLAFHLQPRFIQTRTFLTLTGIAITGLALAVHQVRVRFERKLLHLKQTSALERERARIAQDIHDDLGASLTQISLLGELTLRDPQTPDHTRHRLERSQSAVRELHRSMDEIVWATNPRHDSLESLANYTARFAQQFFAESKTRIRLHFPPMLPNLKLGADARHNLFLAAKESLNNIAKHAQASEVQLHLNLDPNGRMASLRIQDNGHGFTPPPPAKTQPRRQGNGLQNIRSRLQTIGGSMTINSSNEGTSVELRFPIQPLPGS